jgi:Domain of unknown function (DUF4411)
MELISRYILDTNIIIDVTRRIYPQRLRDEARAIVERLISEGSIVSHKEVLLELEVGAKPGDVPLAWAKANSRIFGDLTSDQEDFLMKVLDEHPGILDPKKTGPDADPLLVALALEIGGVAVTGDGSTQRSGKTQIKDVCDAYGIRCIDVDTFLSENGWPSEITMSLGEPIGPAAS